MAAAEQRPSLAEANRFARAMLGLGAVGRVSVDKKNELLCLANRIKSGEVSSGVSEA